MMSFINIFKIDFKIYFMYALLTDTWVVSLCNASLVKFSVASQSVSLFVLTPATCSYLLSTVKGMNKYIINYLLKYNFKAA